MRVIFPEVGERQLDDLLALAERRTNGTVKSEPNGFKVFSGHLPGGHVYFHKSYQQLEPRHLMVFPNLFEMMYNEISYNGLPPEIRNTLFLLMASNEHYDFSEAAVAKIPSQILSKVPMQEAELGAWGAFSHESAAKAAEEMGYGDISEYLAKILPVFTTIDGQHVIMAQLRANRPGGNGSKGNGLQPQVFQSIHYGHPGNEQALRDVLFASISSGQLQTDRRSLDSLINNPKELSAKGIGSLVNGAAMVLSLDSEDSNARYSAILDQPFSAFANVRDLSPLNIAGVKAISIVNRFSSLANSIDSKLHPALSQIGFEVPNAPVKLNGRPVFAEGMSIVTYCTGFETGTLNKERTAALYRSMQLTIQRIVQLPGYKNASFMIGENTGKGGAQSLKETHIQGYISRFVDIHPEATRLIPTRENALYENGSVYVIAHPISYSQVILQFKTDKPFLKRSETELLDFADALTYHLNMLDKLGITSDRNVYMSGNDFAVRPVPGQEKDLRLGFFERGSGIRVVTSANTAPVELAAIILGDQKQFIVSYKTRARIH